MTAEILCIVSFIVVFVSARKSLGFGITALLAAGYGYGLLRANIPAAASHFVFDAAVLGLYAAIFMTRTEGLVRYREMTLHPWLVVLIIWPVMLFFIPQQDWMIQLVGLRGAVFFLPFLLLGARMEDRDFHIMTLAMAVLNTIETTIGLWQFNFGIQAWYPRSQVTQLIYMSNDVIGGAYRIPATFLASASYGGMMAFTVPFLLAAWLKASGHILHRRILEIGLLAAAFGVFLSASRTAAIFLALSLAGIFVNFRLKAVYRIWITALLLSVGWFVSQNQRLQRFITLGDLPTLTERIQASVNSSFIDMLINHPMGNGLGGGGTSIPYFLESRIQDRMIIENEYGLILIEEGLPGLMIWIAFVIWALIAAWPRGPREENPGRFFLWCALAFSFGGAPMGTGLLTAIPLTPVLMLACGWLIGKRREDRLLMLPPQRAPLPWQQALSEK